LEGLVRYRIFFSVISGVLAAVLIVSASQSAAAQEWPTHPIIAGEAEKWGPIIKAADIHM
jgi:hypothetical protein